MTLTESIRDELVKVFTVPQAEVLADCVVKAHDTLATRSDMHELRQSMKEMSGEVKSLVTTVGNLAAQQQETSAEVRELAQQQRRTSAEVQELAQQQKRTSAEVQELAQQQKQTSAEVQELAQQQKQTSVDVQELAQQQKLTSAEVRELVIEHTSMSGEIKELAGTVADLTDSIRTLNIRTDKTAGWALEWVVGKHLPAYVGRQIKGCRVIGTLDVIDVLAESPIAHEYTEEEFDQLRRADLVATGTIDGEPLFLIGEVSFTADNNDVLRASRRAALVRRSGSPAQPFVACEAIGPLAAELARKENVWVILKGRLLPSAA
jgi:DNA polymerase III alpha subunit (gram-positive type)